MKTIDYHETIKRFAELLSEIEQNSETFIIFRNGKPVAKLAPPKEINRLNYHPTLSKIKINYDPTEELTKGEWEEIK